jgi:lipopolysaccharide exporter
MNINNAPKSGVIKKALTDFLKNPGKGLYQRAVRSGIWVFSLRIFERALSVVKLVVLARILVPNDFGLMGIALLAMTCLETFSQTGLQQALIQKKEGTEKYLDVAWTFLLIRNLAIFAILFIGAPYIAMFFDTPKVTPIMRIIGIFLLFGGPGGIGGFANIGVLYFQKEPEFNKQFIYHLTGTLADFIVSVTAAIVLRSVWA